MIKKENSRVTPQSETGPSARLASSDSGKDNEDKNKKPNETKRKKTQKTALTEHETNRSLIEKPPPGRKNVLVIDSMVKNRTYKKIEMRLEAYGNIALISQRLSQGKHTCFIFFEDAEGAERAKEAIGKDDVLQALFGTGAKLALYNETNIELANDCDRYVPQKIHFDNEKKKREGKTRGRTPRYFWAKFKLGKRHYRNGLKYLREVIALKDSKWKKYRGGMLIDVNPVQANILEDWEKEEECERGPFERIFPHPSFNLVEGTIFERELEGMSTDEILEECPLEVVEVVRPSQALPLYILKFASESLPQDVKLWGVKAKIRRRDPKPMLCRQCLQYGHTKKRCTSHERCNNCAGRKHPNDTQCHTCCAHCNLPHPTGSGSCEVHLRERELLTAAQIHKVDLREARIILNYGRRTFADVTQKRPEGQIKTRPPEPRAVLKDLTQKKTQAPVTLKPTEEVSQKNNTWETLNPYRQLEDEANSSPFSLSDAEESTWMPPVGKRRKKTKTTTNSPTSLEGARKPSSSKANQKDQLESTKHLAKRGARETEVTENPPPVVLTKSDANSEEVHSRVRAPSPKEKRPSPGARNKDRRPDSTKRKTSEISPSAKEETESKKGRTSIHEKNPTRAPTIALESPNLSTTLPRKREPGRDGPCHPRRVVSLEDLRMAGSTRSAVERFEGLRASSQNTGSHHKHDLLRNPPNAGSTRTASIEVRTTPREETSSRGTQGPASERPQWRN